MINTLWAEQYRPSMLKDCVLPNRIEDVIKSYLDNNDIPNMVFYGSAGNSKTTTARVIANELKTETLFINASDETSKSAILDLVVPFATGLNSENSNAPKIVILDECDRLDSRASDSLKGVIEKVSSNCRFLLTANNFSKIIPPIKSRCICLNFNVLKEEKPELMAKFFKRLVFILKDKNVEFDPKVLQQVVMGSFPDYRKTINNIQSYVTSHKKLDEGILGYTADDLEDVLYGFIKAKDFENAKKYLVESNSSYEDLFNALYSGMEKYLSKKQMPQAIITIADYSYKSSMCLNQQLNVLACMIELMAL